MSVATALRAGVGDFYRQSWRLALLNASVSSALAAVVTAALFIRAAFILAVLVGPLAAMLMHCCLTLLRTHELRLADAGVALRTTWRRGLALGACVVGAAILGIVAVPFYAGFGMLALPLAALTVYLVVAFLVLQVALWPLAVLEHDRPLLDAFRTATTVVLRRPFGFLALGGALTLVNALGLLLGLVPFFTLTIAYSFLVSARFALPHTQPEAESWRVSPTTT
jgi:hypothetical protein